MEKKKIKLTICGTAYYITTEDDTEYVESLGTQLDARISKTLKNSKFISLTQAAILTALEYADEAKKAEDSADNLRAQVKDYLEDAAKAKSERDFYKREIERLKTGNTDTTPTNSWT